jgi:hypothetical protein
MRTITLARVALAGAALAVASQTAPAPVASELGAAFRIVAQDAEAAAAKMPDSKYGYRPVDAVRSFGQIIAHVAGGHFLYCSQAAGRRLEADLARRLNALRPFADVATAAGARQFEKSELVSLLGESVVFCEAIYGDRTLTSDTALRHLIGNIAHTNEHYGNLVTYLRINGIVPPSTERRTSSRNLVTAPRR